MASSREFYIIVRLRGEQESDVFSYLSRIEESINDNGFTDPPSHRGGSQKDAGCLL